MMSMKTKIIIAVLFLKLNYDIQALEVHEHAIETINSCFMDRLQVLTTTPELFDLFHRILPNSDPIPMIIIDENFKSDEAQHLLIFLGIFFLPANTKESFRAILLAAESSPWWNVNALVIIVGNPQDGCTSALEVLKETWKMYLQSVLFLCEHEKGVMLYTFNPHGNRAPYPWKEVGILKKPDDPWALFAQPYVAGTEKCGSLDFHRTKFIDVCKAHSVHKCSTWEEVGEDPE